jgi:cardiolipin synthase A/B
VFRVNELRHFRSEDLKTLPEGERVVLVKPILAADQYRADELLEAALEEDEQLPGLEPAGELATRYLALVSVVGGEVQGLPEGRAFPELKAAILQALPAASVRASRQRARPSSQSRHAAPESELRFHRLSFAPEDLLIGGAEHRQALQDALRRARSRLIIHSTFLGEDKFRALLPLMIAAVQRGVRIDILWGQELPTAERPRGRPTAAETVQKLSTDPDIARHRDLLRIQTQSTRSHAKLLISDLDARDHFVALVGSCNWLDTPFAKVEASVYLRETDLVRDTLRSLVRLIHSGGGTWPTLATELQGLAQRVANLHHSAPRNARASLVIGDAHNACLLRARDQVKATLLLTSNRLGRKVRSAALIPLAQACRQRGVQARLLYSSFAGIDRAEASACEIEAKARGLSLTPVHNPKIHAKMLAWDSDTIVVTSQNWLSADPGYTNLARELGIIVESPGIATLLMNRFNQSLGTPATDGVRVGGPRRGHPHRQR